MTIQSLTLGNAQLFKKIASKLESGSAVAVSIFSADEGLLLEKMAKFKHLLTWNVMHGFREVVKRYDIEGNFTGIAQETFYFSDNAKHMEEQEEAQHSLLQSLNFLLTAAPERDYTLCMFDVPLLVSRFSETEKTVVERAMKELIDRFKFSGSSEDDGIKRLILVGQQANFSDDFKGRITNIQIDRPTQAEVRAEIESWIPGFLEEFDNFSLPESEIVWTAILNSAAGLYLSEVVNILRETATYYNEVGLETANALHTYKVEQLRQMGIEVLNPPKQEIGGLINVKKWLSANLLSILDTEDADDELRPKGIMVIGIPGTGKSLIAKQIGKMTNLPTFKIDGSAFLGSLVGESEKKTKELLQLLDSAAPAVVFLDELDKIFAGVSGNGSNDGGTKKGVFGMVLSWMQDLKPGLFVIGAANDISNLPPEFLRKGRFDEIFFVDLPNEQDRAEIIKVHLSRFAVGLTKIDDFADTLAQDKYSENLTGAEIESAIKQSAVIARNAGRKGLIELTDLINEFEAAQASCLAVQQREQIEYLKAQASRFTPASNPITKKTASASANGKGSAKSSTVTSSRKAGSRPIEE